MAKTHEQFLDELNTITQNIEVLTEYVNSKEKVLCRCKVCGNEWSASPSKLLIGRGCPKCGRKRVGDKRRNSSEKFLQRLEQVNPNILVLGEYTGADNKILCRCKVCNNEWYPTPSNLYAGKGCPKCSRVYRRSHEEFVQEVCERNDSVKVLDTFVSTSKKVRCKCKVCQYEWKVMPSSLLLGSGCPKCAGTAKRTHEEFIEHLSAINGNISVLGQYKNAKTKIECECKICKHKWSAIPQGLIEGSGCPRCAGTLKKTHEDFVRELKDINPLIEPMFNYTGANTKVDVKCKRCGYIWRQTPHSLLQGHGCPKCSGNIKKTQKDIVREIGEINKFIEIVGKYQGMGKHIRCKCRICGNEWAPIVSSIYRGTGCPNCNHKSTSFAEQFMFYSLILSGVEAINRDKSAIGFELDIYIPDRRVAIEPGGWIWHKDRINKDIEKRNSCAEKGIRLITIYDAVPQDIIDNPPIREDFWYYQSDVGSEPSKTLLKEIVYKIFLELGIRKTFTESEWKKIENEAYINSRRKTHQEFLDEVSLVNPNIEILDDYKGDSKPVKCKCRICGYKWLIPAYSVLKGTGCRKCAGTLLKTNDEFLDELNTITQNIEVLTEYVNSKEKVLCRCKVCGNEWSASPSKLLIGRGCPKCGRKRVGDKRRNPSEKFLQRLEQVNPNILVLGEYTGADNKILCRCKVCNNEWYPTPSNLYAGKGCPKCSKVHRRTHEEFVDEMHNKNVTIEILDRFVNTSTKIRCRCKTCQYEWKVVPSSLLAGTGCPQCAKRK